MKDIYISGEPQEIQYQDVYSDSSFTPNQLPPEHKKTKNKKSKSSKSKRFFKFIIIIFIIITLIISTIASISGYTRNNLKRNEYISIGELSNSPFVTNILLIGADASNGGSSRSDTMMLISFDYIHFKIKLTSFLRDCYVEIPSTGKNKKLNAACSIGGAQLVCDTIEYNFKIDIDHYLKVDFEMFTKIIDELGGIDVQITEEEAKFINKTTRYTVSSGENVHLNGNEALVYARIRKLDSDYMRTFRQRKIIEAVIGKISHTNIIDLINTSQKVLPLLETDLNPLEISILAYKGGFAALAFKIAQTKLPTEDLMKTGYAGSEWVEFPNMEGCIDYLYKFIYRNGQTE